MSFEPVGNLLLEKVEYQTDETSFGTWRRFLYPSGELFEEFISHQSFFDLPLLHYTRGRCPETGKRIVAKGIIAIGRLAYGAVAIGLLLGLGQASTGLFALGQLAIAAAIGVGQVATGYVVIAQIGIGVYVLAQIGFGQFVWDMWNAAPEAKQFFRSMLP